MTSRARMARWLPLTLLAAWWLLDIRHSTQIALSPFAFIGEVPPAVRAWTLVASALMEVGHGLPWAVPLIACATATLRSARSRVLVACAVLVACILAAHWLEPAANLAADHRMPGSDPHAPAQDFRELTTPQLLRIPGTEGITNLQSAIARGLVAQRTASVVAVAVLLAPVVALRRRVALRWFVAPALTIAMIALNSLAFRVLGPRLSSPAAPMIWIVGPAIPVSVLLWVALRRRDHLGVSDP